MKHKSLRGCYCNAPDCGKWIERGEEVYAKKYGRICVKCVAKLGKKFKPLEQDNERRT